MAKTPNLGAFAAVGNLSKGPANATAWTALKAIGLEVVFVVILTVIAGTGPTAANFALGFLGLIALLLLVTHKT